MNGLILVFAAMMAIVAHACFAVTMPRHWREVSQRASSTPPHPRRLRGIGFAAFGGCLALCIGRDGVGFGIVLWVMLVSAAAFLIALLLAWRPHVLVFGYRGDSTADR